jgi:hypothetical protein
MSAEVEPGPVSFRHGANCTVAIINGRRAVRLIRGENPGTQQLP